jgi:VCBS repeat protein
VSAMLCRTAGIVAVAAMASTTIDAQQDISAVVAGFYPQSLVDLAARSGEPFDRNQCYAVFDALPSGAPKTVVAAYTNESSAAIRVLRSNASGGFEIAAEPIEYDLSGEQCQVKLVDLDNDGRNEIFVSFSAMVNDVSWVFAWDGQQLTNLTPLGASWRSGTKPTRLFRTEIVDVDNDGVKELLVNSQYPPRLNEPSKPDLLFRLVGGQFVEDQPLIGLWAFERLTSTPETSRTLINLPERALGPYTLHVVNGTAGGQFRATSAQLWLNGQQILGPSDFGSSVAFIDRPITLDAENELTVRFAGAPGSKMTVILKSQAWSTP